MSENQKNSIKKLALQDVSLNKISRELKLPKTTVYYWTRKVIGRKIKQIIFNFNDEDLSEFLGVFAGDGYAKFDISGYKYNVLFFFNKNNKQYIDRFKAFLFQIFGKYPINFTVDKDNTVILKFQSKLIFCLIKKYLDWKCFGIKGSKARTIQLNKKNCSKNFIIGFLRGCLDSDGHFSKEKGAIFATVSLSLAETIRSFLRKLGFNPKFKERKDKRPNRHPIFIIRVGFPDCSNLIKLLKPRNPTKSAAGGI